MMQSLSQMMMEALKFFFNISGNWGIAIILLTIAVKLVLYPLTAKSTASMAGMQKIQPKVEALQKKYKDEPEKAQKEVMELYKSEGVNPLGGCLPMLIQIPVFLALFWALSSPSFKQILSAAGTKGQFFGLNLYQVTTFAQLTDFSHFSFSILASWILILLIGLSTYWSSSSMPGSQSGQQKTMLYFMPGFITIISVSFPAGVQLYWVVQNLLTAAQQVYVLRK
jgi:YidC/Oxa1 family membrane protein insertase